MNIPFLSFAPMHALIKADMMRAFEQVYDSYWYVLGQRTTDFERDYASFSGTRHCVGVSNGLDALLLLKAVGAGDGDEVIVPSNSYIATLLAVTFCGAKPVLVEPDGRTYNIDPQKLDSAVTSRTKAVIPIHLYGQSCEMDAILDVARRHSLHVVEDNAQSHGAAWKGRVTGKAGERSTPRASIPARTLARSEMQARSRPTTTRSRARCVRSGTMAPRRNIIMR